MIFVCNDPSGDKWYYANEKYIRMSGDKVRSRISGKYIPDPFVLWTNRCKEHNCAEMGKVVPCKEHRPTDATFELFKHWESVNA